MKWQEVPPHADHRRRFHRRAVDGQLDQVVQIADGDGASLIAPDLPGAAAFTAPAPERYGTLSPLFSELMCRVPTSSRWKPVFSLLRLDARRYFAAGQAPPLCRGTRVTFKDVENLPRENFWKSVKLWNVLYCYSYCKTKVFLRYKAVSKGKGCYFVL